MEKQGFCSSETLRFVKPYLQQTGAINERIKHTKTNSN